MTKLKVVVTTKIPENWLQPLFGLTEVTMVEYGGPATLVQLIEQLNDTDGAMTMLSDPMCAEVMDQCPKLKVIANYAVGTNNIDLAAAKKRNIVVCNTPNVLTEATAELAMALLLAASRRIVEADRMCRDGKFEGWKSTLLLGMQLSGKTLGIYGMGRIGQAMARMARGFGMQIVYHNRRPIDNAVERSMGARWVSFDHLLATSDVISLHCPLNDESRGRFDRLALSSMKKGSILINTARGQVVDEAALADLLAQGHLRAAGLDVFEHEPAIHPMLATLPNVVMAPHIGSATEETRQTMAHVAASDIAAVLTHQTPKNRVI